MDWFQSLSEDLRAHFESAFYFFGGLIWLLHLFRKTGRVTMFIVAMCGLAAVLFIVIVIRREPIDILALTSVLWLYGVCLYVVLCDFMIWKLARFLTSMRGPQWAKELDYVYLTFTSIGIIVVLNKYDFVTGHMPGTDIVAPLILTSAIVVRYIKTRAEIEGWNSPEFGKA